MLDYIKSIITLIFAVSMMYMLLDCKFKRKMDIYLMSIYVTCLFVFDLFILIKFGYSTFMKFYPLLIQFPVYFAFVAVSKYNAIKVFFIHLTLVAITTSLSLIGLIVAYFFDSSTNVVNVVCYIFYLPAAFVIYRYLRPSFLYMLRNTNKGWFGFCIIPLSYSTLLYLTGKYNLDAVMFRPIMYNVVVFFILTLASYIMILRIFSQTREQLTLQNEQYLLKTQIDAAKAHLGALEESHEKTIIYRHDMRHHLDLIDSYLADGNKAEAQKYITDVKKMIDSTAVEKYCSNYTVNLILYSYINKAKNEQIKVETHINLPEKNAVSDMDLCVLFSNALENAENACKRVSNADDRIISIVCKTENEKLFIQIINRYEAPVTFVDDMPVSTEKDHGLGTKSIAAIAQKYGGLYSFTADNDVFKTSVIL